MFFLAEAKRPCTQSLVQDVMSASFLEDAVFSPFHVASLIIFVLAIIHTFFANKFTDVARRLEIVHQKKKAALKAACRYRHVRRLIDER